MAQLVLSRVGAEIGRSVLPNGVQVFGSKFSGASLGRAAGSYIANALFAPVRDGPRIETLALMESREGAGIPNIYGRMRVAGQIIWAARFKEHSRQRRPGGKTGPKVRDFNYSVSFAVALCEGEAARIGEVWANGEPMDLAGVTWRFYTGSENQVPDPLIEAIEGADAAPAYRGISYIVFEDLPLAEFGNRLPQLSFEVFRTAPDTGEATAIRDLIEGVNIIPASGEFAYDPQIVSERRFPGIETPQNVNSARGEADFSVSMDQLEADLSNVRRAALTVGWFGDDLNAGLCQIRPGVETDHKVTVPEIWSAGGVERGEAYLISKDANGHSNYGGTPSDASIIRAVRSLSSRGISPTLTPFLFMDVPSGEAPFPWRGRITGSADDIAAFLGNAQPSDFQIEGERIEYSGNANDWGYRRFVLHLAHLAKIAGEVEAFLIGSEMVALTRARASDGSFPFVEGLAALAADVKVLLGSDVKVSYAADWTEYGAFTDGDDVSFPLDQLWASDAIDFIGVDWYPPMADWRDGDVHLDALAGYNGPEDFSYLSANITGGEGYEWYYANQEDRDLQQRTAIVDTAHNEHWVFRQKDLLGWWSNAHHARPSGVRSTAPTAWTPQSKPIRLMEIGFPAVDKGANSPNLFYDPKSSESALPPFSNGARDDIQQRRALEAAITFWQAQPAIEAVYVWCWDARPYPAFPVKRDVWSDGSNWRFGHWLNGRVGTSELGAIVQDICARGGVDVDTSALSGLVEGYGLSGVYSVRGAIEALKAAHGFHLVEQSGKLVFTSDIERFEISIAPADIQIDGVQFQRGLLDKRPGALRLTYISGSDAYAPATVTARDLIGDRTNIVDVSLPIVMSDAQAEQVAEALLARSTRADKAEVVLSLQHLGIECGDVMTFETDEAEWRVTDIEDTGISRVISLEEYVPSAQAFKNTDPSRTFGETLVPVVPELLVIDALGDAPLVAAAALPWPGTVQVLAGRDPAQLSERAELEAPALIGLALEPIAIGPIGRWDHASQLRVYLPIGSLSSAPPSAVLSGANRLLIETSSGWELIGFADADLIGQEEYLLHGFLRGLNATTPGDIRSNAKFVSLDEAVKPVLVTGEEIGQTLHWRTEVRGKLGEGLDLPFESQGTLAYRPGHLRADWHGAQLNVSWVRRGVDVPESWALPETENGGRFRVEFWGGGSLISSSDVTDPLMTTYPPVGAESLRVAEIGVDGRPGAYTVLSIPTALA